MAHGTIANKYAVEEFWNHLRDGTRSLRLCILMERKTPPYIDGVRSVGGVQVWVSQRAGGFAFQITKANLAQTKPELGVSAKVSF